MLRKDSVAQLSVFVKKTEESHGFCIVFSRNLNILQKGNYP